MRLFFRVLAFWAGPALVIFALSVPARGTVFIVARHNGTIWIATSSNLSHSDGEHFVSDGEHCKIYPSKSGQLTVVHAGAVAGAGHLFTHEVIGVLNHMSPLGDNKTKAVSKIKEIYTSIFQKYPGIPINAQSFAFISWKDGNQPRILGFDVAGRTGLFGPEFYPFDFPLPESGDFVYIHDGELQRKSVDAWPKDAEDAQAFLTRKVQDFSTKDSARWGGPISIAKISPNEGFQWVTLTDACRRLTSQK